MKENENNIIQASRLTLWTPTVQTKSEISLKSRDREIYGAFKETSLLLYLSLKYSIELLENTDKKFPQTDVLIFWSPLLNHLGAKKQTNKKKSPLDWSLKYIKLSNFPVTLKTPTTSLQ